MNIEKEQKMRDKIRDLKKALDYISNEAEVIEMLLKDGDVDLALLRIRELFNHPGYTYK